MGLLVEGSGDISIELGLGLDSLRREFDCGKFSAAALVVPGSAMDTDYTGRRQRPPQRLTTRVATITSGLDAPGACG